MFVPTHLPTTPHRTITLWLLLLIGYLYNTYMSPFLQYGVDGKLGLTQLILIMFWLMPFVVLLYLPTWGLSFLVTASALSLLAASAPFLGPGDQHASFLSIALHWLALFATMLLALGAYGRIRRAFASEASSAKSPPPVA